MANFEIAYGITRKHEGGWHGATGVNSADRGGETFKGIARRIWPQWEGWAVLDRFRNQQGFPRNAENDAQLTTMVRNFYRINFWDVNRLSEINSQAIANEMFDTGVNVGSRTAVLWLQRALNVLNRNGRTWQDINPPTGVVGPITLGIVNRLSAVDTKHLFNVLNIIQGHHYIAIAERDRTQEEFMRGWLERVDLMK
jgi:lysozyme family protein